MPCKSRLTWKRNNPRFYVGYSGREDIALIFGSPEPSSYWCSVFWFQSRPTGNIEHVTEYHTSFSAAKAWVRRQVEEPTR